MKAGMPRMVGTVNSVNALEMGLYRPTLFSRVSVNHKLLSEPRHIPPGPLPKVGTANS